MFYGKEDTRHTYKNKMSKTEKYIFFVSFLNNLSLKLLFKDATIILAGCSQQNITFSGKM
jgi:hypothetical protein